MLHLEAKNGWLAAYSQVSIHIIYIGIGKFRILGGQGLEYWGAKFPAGTLPRNDVDKT